MLVIKKVMETLTVIVLAIAGLVGRITSPIRRSCWYSALWKWLRAYFWLAVIALIVHPCISQVLWVGAIIFVGYIRKYGWSTVKNYLKQKGKSVWGSVEKLGKTD